MKKFIKKIKQKKKDKKFSDYPCSTYLHNALYFISVNNPDAAYEEICYALLKSGDKLSSEEKELFNKIQEKDSVKNTDGLYLDLFAVKDGVRYNAKTVSMKDVSHILTDSLMDGIEKMWCN